jgi:hypothetical protein
MTMHYVDYVEWHVVADLLDELAPDWSHAVRNVVQIGDFVAATAAITINGITREGIGTGAADSETGIKKAEHDALKRAAVKFGIARELYRDEDRPGETHRPATSKPPANPIAQNIGELLTTKQSALINKLAQRLRREADDVCYELFHARLNEISRRAASQLIDHLEAALNPNGHHSSQHTRDRAV